MNVGSLNVRIGAKDTQLKKGLKSGENQVKKFGKTIKKIGGLIAGAFAISKIIQWSKVLKDAYQIQKEGEVKLATVIKQRMGLGKEAVKNLLDQASAYQKVGIIGDEVQIAGMQQLATFLNQKKSLEDLLPAMNNLLAQQKGFNAQAGDAVNIANMLGKVFVGQVGALSRVGISFTEAQEKALKYGTELEKAAMLAQVITDNVGNMNAELAKTDLGEIKNAENIIGDIKEEIGKRLIPEIKFWKKLQLGILEAVIRTKEGIENISYKKATVEVKEYEKADKKTREKILSGWEKQADIFFDKWIEAKKRGDQANRDFYATQFSLTKDTIANLKAVDDASENINDTLKGRIPILEKINKKIIDFKELRDLSLTIEEYKKWNRELKTAEERLINLNKILEEPKRIKRIKKFEAPEKPPKALGIIPETGTLADMSGAIERNIELSNKFIEALRGIETGALAVADAMTIAAVEGGASLKDLAGMAIKAARKVIAAQIAEGITGAVKTALISLPPPFNIAMAAIAGAGAAALFNSIIPQFAKGGSAFEPTLAMVGEGIGVSKTNPEYIGTASQLSKMGIGGSRIKVDDIIIRGEDLRVVLEAVDRKHANSY